MIRPSQEDGIPASHSSRPRPSKASRATSGGSEDVGDQPDQSPRPSWNWKKTLGSILIVLHLLAVAIAPASVPPSSPTIQNGWLLFQPYLQLAFLNHGYHYFAPDPGPSSLIEYTVVTQDGQRIWGRIPDRNTIWPRLLYHRHFMLTEFYGGLPPAAAEMRQAVAETYAQQLMHQHQGVSVELSHVVHLLSTRQEVIAGGHLNDPHKYEFTPLGTFSLQTPENLAALTSGLDPQSTAETQAGLEPQSPMETDLPPMPVSESSTSTDGRDHEKVTE